MKDFYLLITFLIVNFTNAQTEETIQLVNCQKEWEYKELNGSFIAKIQFYEQPTELCGTLMTASVAIVITQEKKILRILTLCHNRGIETEEEFIKGDKVRIKPHQPPKSKISLIPYDPETCFIKDAYFGSLSKTK